MIEQSDIIEAELRVIGDSIVKLQRAVRDYGKVVIVIEGQVVGGEVSVAMDTDPATSAVFRVGVITRCAILA